MATSALPKLVAVALVAVAAYVALSPPAVGVVAAGKSWNPVGYDVAAGKVYKVAVAPNQTWTDGYVDTDADGYDSTLLLPFAALKRVPSAPWFALVCCVGEDEATCEAVGSGPTKFVPKASGELSCFANDAPLLYFNNHGALNVTVA